MPNLTEIIKYPLPSFLEGRLAPAVYYKWLNVKAITLLKRDRKRKKAYAVAATMPVYKSKIHNAVNAGGERDPYTGEELAWELIMTWDTSHDQPDGYKKKFALMPTVDHTNPDVLEFEICSWEINDAKCDLDPTEFVALCKKVVDHSSK
jgi:hypothetical protein